MIVSETRGTIGRLTALPTDGGAGADITPADDRGYGGARRVARYRRVHVAGSRPRAGGVPGAEVPVGRVYITTTTGAGNEPARRGRGLGTACRSAMWRPPPVALADGSRELEGAGRQTIEGLLTYPGRLRRGRACRCW